MSEKECTKCGEVKAFSEYGKHKLGKHGLMANCRVCRKEYMKQYRQANKNAITEQRKQYYRTNKEVVDERLKQWRQANKEAIVEYRKQYNQANKEKKNKYERKRRAKNPAVRMIESLRCGLWHAMNGKQKPKKTMEFLGCTLGHLEHHLSAQFEDGMTLENYGADGWVIDHIMPVSRFDHNDPEQVATCWHYTNMQPLWDRDNKIKSDMLPHEWEELKRQRQTVSL